MARFEVLRPARANRVVAAVALVVLVLGEGTGAAGGTAPAATAVVDPAAPTSGDTVTVAVSGGDCIGDEVTVTVHPTATTGTSTSNADPVASATTIGGPDGQWTAVLTVEDIFPTGHEVVAVCNGVAYDVSGGVIDVAPPADLQLTLSSTLIESAAQEVVVSGTGCPGDLVFVGLHTTAAPDGLGTLLRAVRVGEDGSWTMSFSLDPETYWHEYEDADGDWTISASCTRSWNGPGFIAVLYAPVSLRFALPAAPSVPVPAVPVPAEPALTG